LDPDIILVAARVELSERLQTLLCLVMINEPSRRFGEEGDQKCKDPSRDDLEAERNTPLVIVRITKMEVGSVNNPN
jgi:hypothetical protein